MNSSESSPVVVGSSFSGVLISLMLSRAGVDHVVVGGHEPDESPKLGESLNECASPELFGLFGEEFRDCFFTKSHISLLNGDFASQLVVANPHRCKNRMAKMYPFPGDTSVSTWRTFGGCITGRNLMHVDRTKLDNAVYWKARKNQHCRFVHALVDDVVVDDDQIQTLVLSNGESLKDPKYVFDTTGFRQVIGSAAGVETNPIGELNRVVWTHYERDSVSGECERWWHCGTNLLKLEQATDGLDGISWLIPLGNTVSVGVSVAAEQYSTEEFTDEQIMRLTNEAYTRRGVDYPVLFPDHSKPIMQLQHKYYSRNRAYGKNWLLVGGTFLSVWFPSSAGLWSVAAANRLIPEILDDPLKYGAEYEAALSPLTDFHHHLDVMINGPSFRRPSDAYLFWARWLAGVPWRAGEYLRMISAQRGNFFRFRFLRWISATYRRLPVTMLLFWGFFVLRVVRQPIRQQQSQAFRSYFSVTRYRIGNYIRGIANSWRS